MSLNNKLKIYWKKQSSHQEIVNINFLELNNKLLLMVLIWQLKEANFWMK